MRTFSQTHPHTSQGLRNTEALDTLDTNIPTYGLNINGAVARIGGLAARVSVETLEVLRVLRVSGDPVWVRVHCDGLEKGTRLPRVESFLQKMSFFFCVLSVKFSQVLTIRHQSCLQRLHRVLDHLHLRGEIHSIDMVTDEVNMALLSLGDTFFYHLWQTGFKKSCDKENVILKTECVLDISKHSHVHLCSTQASKGKYTICYRKY